MTGLLKHLQPSFSVVAGKRHAPSFLDRFKAHLIERGVIAENAGVMSYEVKPTGVVLIRMGSTLSTLPLDGVSAIRIRNAIAKRRQIAGLLAAGTNEYNIGFLIAGEFEGIPYVVDEFSVCMRAREMAATGVKVVEMSMDWLSKFQRPFAVTKTFHASASLPCETQSYIAMIDERTSGTLSALLQRCEGRQVVVGPVHGDFHLGNILMSKSGVINRVIDWDLAMLEGLPLWDALTMVSHEEVMQGVKWAEAYHRAADSCLAKPLRESGLAEYIDSMRLGGGDLLSAIATYPVMILTNKMQFGDRNEDIVLNGLEDVLKELLSRYATTPRSEVA